MTNPPSIELTIHRGCREIGGSCVRMRCGETRILLDMGSPLTGERDAAPPNTDDVDAVLISHPHQDHFGLIDHLDPKIPVFIGRLGHRLIEATRLFLGRAPFDNAFSFIDPWEPFVIGEFTITPHLVDHSTPEAFAFEVTAAGKCLFYSGDFRAHGRKSVLFFNMLKKPPREIDVMLMEGTMMRRNQVDLYDEDDVEERVLETLRSQTGLTFVISSAQNIDRIVSVYRACKRADKVLIIDFYAAWVLEQLKLVSDSVPRIGWPLIGTYAFFKWNQVLKSHPKTFSRFTSEVYKCRVTQEEIARDPSRYVFLTQVSKSGLIEKFAGGAASAVIYSMWEGYLESADDEYFGAETLRKLKEDGKIEFVKAHCSGHAYVEDLEALASAIDPKMLIPIHTEYPQDYASQFANVHQLEDGEVFTIG